MTLLTTGWSWPRWPDMLNYQWVFNTPLWRHVPVVLNLQYLLSDTLWSKFCDLHVHVDSETGNLSILDHLLNHCGSSSCRLSLIWKYFNFSMLSWFKCCLSTTSSIVSSAYCWCSTSSGSIILSRSHTRWLSPCKSSILYFKGNSLSWFWTLKYFSDSRYRSDWWFSEWFRFCWWWTRSRRRWRSE